MGLNLCPLVNLFRSAPKANLRQLYTDEVAGLEKVGKDLLASGKSEAEVAQTLNQMRRDLGIKYKEMTPPDLLDYIYKFNEARTEINSALYTNCSSSRAIQTLKSSQVHPGHLGI